MKRVLLIGVLLAAIAPAQTYDQLMGFYKSLADSFKVRGALLNDQAITIKAREATITTQAARIALLEAALLLPSAWEAKIDAKCPTCRGAIDAGLASSPEEWSGVLVRRARAGLSVPEIAPATAVLYLAPSAWVTGYAPVAADKKTAK